MKAQLKDDSNSNCKKVRHYYTCYWKCCSKQDLINAGKDRCTLTSVDAEHVDAILWGHIVRILSNPAEYAEQWFSDKDVGLLKAKIAKLQADEKTARDRAVAAFKNLATPCDIEPELIEAFRAECDKFQARYKEIKDQRQRAERELASIDNKINVLASYRQAIQAQAENDNAWVGDEVRGYWDQIHAFLNNLPFAEKKRIVDAVVAPHDGGKVTIRYQRPRDYIDFATNEADGLDETDLNEPQERLPKYIDTTFEVDLERVLAVISGLNKNNFLRKFREVGRTLAHVDSRHLEVPSAEPLTDPISGIQDSEDQNDSQRSPGPWYSFPAQQDGSQQVIQAHLQDRGGNRLCPHGTSIKS